MMEQTINISIQYLYNQQALARVQTVHLIQIVDSTPTPLNHIH